jgi:hypothetical protein
MDRDGVVGYVKAAYGEAHEGLSVAYGDGLAEDAELACDMKLLDFVPTQGDVAEGVAVEGDGTGCFADKLPVQGVAVAQHQLIGWGFCGSGSGLRDANPGQSDCGHRERNAESPNELCSKRTCGEIAHGDSDLSRKVWRKKEQISPGFLPLYGLKFGLD